MAWLLFVGDMLVMLFMTVLIVVLSMRDTATRLDYSARIPLEDDSSRSHGDKHG